MKRNWDTIRKLLIYFETPDSAPPSDITEDEFIYHAELLLDKGLITDCHVKKFMGGVKILTPNGRLTFEGHDFLDNIRNETVWKKVKNKLSKAGEYVAYSVIKDIASTVFLSFIKEP